MNGFILKLNLVSLFVFHDKTNNFQVDLLNYLVVILLVLCKFKYQNVIKSLPTQCYESYMYKLNLYCISQIVFYYVY